MAANKFGRYVWLVDLIRCHPYITFKEISDKWEDCGLGDGKPLPWKTFMNHKDTVQTIFDIIISCDAKRGYGYYIEDADLLEGNSFLVCYTEPASGRQKVGETHLIRKDSFRE